ncbi:MAG: 5-oxoprolinase subunit PxpB [Vicinamibacterales bacterium]
MRVTRAGDTMIMVELEPVVDPRVNERAIAMGRRVAERQLPGVRDVVPGYCSLGVHFDPLRTDLALLETVVAEEAAAEPATGAGATGRVHEIPVAYGGTDGPDLDEVARAAGMAPAEVIACHSATVYRVYMLGFVPGFAYLGRVDPRIAIPRRRVPRESVPAGAVGIAGAQTGVYPLSTPGGWQIVGRTDAVMFDAARTPASLLQPGDRVRFVPR